MTRGVVAAPCGARIDVRAGASRRITVLAGGTRDPLTSHWEAAGKTFATDAGLVGRAGHPLAGIDQVYAEGTAAVLGVVTGVVRRARVGLADAAEAEEARRTVEVVPARGRSAVPSRVGVGVDGGGVGRPVGSVPAIGEGRVVAPTVTCRKYDKNGQTEEACGAHERRSPIDAGEARGSWGREHLLRARHTTPPSLGVSRGRTAATKAGFAPELYEFSRPVDRHFPTIGDMLPYDHLAVAKGCLLSIGKSGRW